MEDNRRRKQNREAQRRFRKRRSQKQADDKRLSNVNPNPSLSSPKKPACQPPFKPSTVTTAAVNTAAVATNMLTSSLLDTDTVDCGIGLYSVDGLDLPGAYSSGWIHDSDPSFSNTSALSLDFSPPNTTFDSSITDPLRPTLPPLPEHTRNYNKDTVAVGTIFTKADDCDLANITSYPSPSSFRTGKMQGWQSPLHIAAINGHDRIVRILLQHNIDCNERDSDGLTPLMHAIIWGNEDVATSLLSYGAIIAFGDNFYHRSALHWAILHRRGGLLRLLLGRCVGESSVLDAYDKNGKTPLHTAVDTGYEVGVQLLLQFGANVHYRVRKAGSII